MAEVQQRREFGHLGTYLSARRPCLIPVCVQTDTNAHVASYPMDTDDSFHWGRAAEA
jgi:hypothetical protein